MLTEALVAAMIQRAMPTMQLSERTTLSSIIVKAITAERLDNGYAIDPALVVAIIAVESGGDPQACKDDRFGGSSRGLMQIRVPKSHCGDMKRRSLFNKRENVREGLRIISMLKKWEHQNHHNQHDIMYHYSGGDSNYPARIKNVLGRIK